MATGAQVVQQAQAAAAAAPAYKFGGNPFTGSSWSQVFTDCSGFVIRAFANAGQMLSGRTTFDLVTQGTPVAIAGKMGLANAKPGDLLFFNNNDHVAIYDGNGMLTEDPTTGQTISTRAVYATPDAIRRVATSSGPGGSVTTVAQAIKNATSDANLQLSLALGALLEGGTLGAGPFPTGDNGTSFGPFQIHLPAHPDVTQAQAQDPTSAVQKMLASYQNAEAQVGAAAFKANPEAAAEKTAFLAERPTQDYFASHGQAAVDSAYSQAKSTLAGTTPGGTANGTAVNAGFGQSLLNAFPGGAAVQALGSVPGVSGEVAKGIEAVISDAVGPLVKFLEVAGMVIFGLVLIVIGLVIIAKGANAQGAAVLGQGPKADDNNDDAGDAGDAEAAAAA